MSDCELDNRNTSATDIGSASRINQRCFLSHLISLLWFQHFEDMIGLRFCWIRHSGRNKEVGDGDGSSDTLQIWVRVLPQTCFLSANEDTALWPCYKFKYALRLSMGCHLQVLELSPRLTTDFAANIRNFRLLFSLSSSQTPTTRLPKPSARWFQPSCLRIFVWPHNRNSHYLMQNPKYLPVSGMPIMLPQSPQAHFCQASSPIYRP